MLARFDGRAGIAADSTADAQVGVAAIPQAGDADGDARTETVLANVDAATGLAADWTPDRGAFGVADIPQAGDALAGSVGAGWTADRAADSDGQFGVAAIPQTGDAKGKHWSEFAGGGCTEAVLPNLDGCGAEHHPT